MSEPAGGVLYVVATPLGNLDDISARALRILAEVDFIAAEDTRRTRKLLSRFAIPAPTLFSCFAGNEARRAAEVEKRLRLGERGALVSDAGTPGIADPGARIVQAAIASGAPVIPLPGPSAPAAALSASGFPADRYLFEGFVSSRSTGARGRAEALRRVAETPDTVVFFESPRRIARTLGELARHAPARPCAVFREVTKLYEEAIRGTLGEVAGRVAATPARGEYVIVLGPPAAPPRETRGAGLPEAMALSLRKGRTLADAAREVSRALGVSRSAAYRAGLLQRKKRRRT